MALAFRPIGILLGLAAGVGARKLFEFLWGLIDDQEAPNPEHREIDWLRFIAALLVEGAIFRLVRGLADHGARHGVHKLTGSWPGEERPEPE
jgi:uncharacterized protein DUF4235